METSKIQETKKHRNNKVITFVKQHKKLFLIGFIAITVIVLACILANAINNAVLTDRVQSYLDGKMFIERNGIWTTAYAFNKNTMGKEYWCSSDQNSSGDINERFRYKVKGTLGRGEVQLWYKDDGNWWYGPKAVLLKDGSVEFTDGETWREVTVDEIIAERNVILCEHAFGQDTILKKATCSSGGEVSRVCKKCGFTETEDTKALEHNYQNKICTECGAKKPVQKAYDIQPNTWYVYDNILHFQNCKLINAVSVKQGQAMMVTYKPVCQHCQVIDDWTSVAGPEVDYEVKKIHYCDECGKQTLVWFKIG